MSSRLLWAAGPTLAILAAATCAVPLKTPAQRRDWAVNVISSWSRFSSQTARIMMAQYGPPDRFGNDWLAWDRKGPWTEIRVRDVTPYLDSQLGPADLDQTVDYPVPSERAASVAAFAKVRVSVDRARLTASGTSEQQNFLALNLAHDIIQGLRTPVEARELYARTERLLAAGKTSAYSSGLLFNPRTRRPAAFPLRLYNPRPIWRNGPARDQPPPQRDLPAPDQ